MCRSNKLCLNLIVLVIATCTLAAPSFSQDADEAVASYLESHGLEQLLAVHLRDMIESASGERRRELILQLAGIYARLLDAAADDEQRADLEARSRQLLSLSDAEGAEELRLALLRMSYRTAEQIAEDHRLRLASADQIERAQETFAEITPQLQQLTAHLSRSVTQSSRNLSRASGSGVATITARLNRVQRLHQQAAFLTAWSLYHDAWLNDRMHSARQAEEQFAELLMSDSPRPRPSDISVDLRGEEAFARSILGMALCKSITSESGSPSTAIEWLELLEHESTFASLREQLDIWKIVVHAEHRSFRTIRSMLDATLSQEQSMPVSWLRLIAVHALEAPPTDLPARDLVRMTLNQFAALGELDHILDLAERYGAEQLGQSGFALRYVNGLMLYREARDLHGQDIPVADEAVNVLYDRAIEHLTAALAEPDASAFPVAVGGCLRLMAWAKYFQGQYRDASDDFEAAAEALADAEAAEALWMAIVSLDRLEQPGEFAIERQGSLIERFLSSFPDSPRTGTLLVRRAAREDRLTDDQMDMLISIDEHHSSFETARRRVTQELYQRYRESTGERRIEWGNRYLDAVNPLLAFPAADEAAAQRTVLDVRRTLEIALTAGIERASIARHALSRFEQFVGDGVVEDEQYTDELTLRTAQERLLDGDHSAAQQLVDTLWQHDSRSVWARMGVRSMFAYAHRMRPEDDPVRLELATRYGGRVIREFEDDADALQQSQVRAYHAAVADALTRRWRSTGESQHGRAALFLYQRLLTVHPNNATYLRAAARLAVELDEQEFAANCWRQIAAGSAAGSESWFEARTELLEILVEIDRESASRVMAQHVLLYPEYGPPPWGDRLHRLHMRIQQGADL